MRTCEAHFWGSGLRCHRDAAWTVQVGTRKFDGQYTCSQHLAPTCRAMLQTEDRALTVTRVREQEN